MRLFKKALYELSHIVKVVFVSLSKDQPNCPFLDRKRGLYRISGAIKPYQDHMKDRQGRERVDEIGRKVRVKEGQQGRNKEKPKSNCRNGQKKGRQKDRCMYRLTISPCVLLDFVPFGATALLPLNLNHILLKQGTGTADHVLPLGCYF